MKLRNHLIQLRRFELQEKNRKVSDIEYMIREFEQMAADLDRQVHAEEERTGIRDPQHFSYSTFAKSARQRRDNLKNSVTDLLAQLEAAVQAREAAELELAKVQSPADRETADRAAPRRVDAPADSLTMR
jgi:uncharacterized membrane protein YccC